VSDLWQIRDFWEWLAPGYSKAAGREQALANAAFTSYTGLRKLRDFKMELESGSTAANPKVGLWAKALLDLFAPGPLSRNNSVSFRCDVSRNNSQLLSGLEN
jgi:hypothetical protein